MFIYVVYGADANFVSMAKQIWSLMLDQLILINPTSQTSSQDHIQVLVLMLHGRRAMVFS